MNKEMETKLAHIETKAKNVIGDIEDGKGVVFTYNNAMTQFILSKNEEGYKFEERLPALIVKPITEQDMLSFVYQKVIEGASIAVYPDYQEADL